LASGREVLRLIEKAKSFLLDLNEIFFLPDGVYLVSKSKTVANKVLIFEKMTDEEAVFNEVYLTGPLLLLEFTNILYRYLRFDKGLKNYLRELDERIKDIMRREINTKILDYMRYVKFFVSMLRKWFRTDISEVVSLSELGIERSSVEKVLNYLQEEKTRAFSYVQRWDFTSFFLPPREKIRILSREGFFEYTVSSSTPEKLIALADSKRFIASFQEVLGKLLFLAARNLELERLRYLMHVEKRFKEGLISKDQLIIFLAKELVSKGRISLPVVVYGVRTMVGLRVANGTVYAFINTGEYVVKEILGTEKGAYVYFPPVDICVELRARNLPDGSYVVYPVEAPVIIDEYYHPSIRERIGKRQVCLGNDGNFVNRIIAAAREIAENKKESIQINDEFTVISTEHALAEILKKAFVVVRYGYRPGMTPYRSAAACAGIAGVRIIKDKRELEELRKRGVEIIEP